MHRSRTSPLHVQGILYAEAEEFARNPKLASYTVQVTDENGAKIAIFQGMVYRKTPRH